MKTLPVLFWLLALGGCPHHDDSPLARAAAAGDLAEMTRLLDAGASADPDLHGPTPLIAAARMGQPEAIRLLVKRGADPNRRAGMNDWVPLMHAIHRNREVSVEALLKAGADPNARDRAGATPLHLAAGYGYARIERMLIKAGADPNARDKWGDSALTRAVNGVTDIDRFTLGSCQPDAVKVLLEAAPGATAKREGLARLRSCPDVTALLASAAPSRPR